MKVVKLKAKQLSA